MALHAFQLLGVDGAVEGQGVAASDSLVGHPLLDLVGRDVAEASQLLYDGVRGVGVIEVSTVPLFHQLNSDVVQETASPSSRSKGNGGRVGRGRGPGLGTKAVGSALGTVVTAVVQRGHRGARGLVVGGSVWCTASWCSRRNCDAHLV